MSQISRRSFFQGAALAASASRVMGANDRIRVRAQTRLKEAKPKEYVDMRDMFNSKEVDAVSIATPNHWHSLATIWACQAGKDVYCEKPASYNIHESFRMIEVARQTKRMV